MGALVFGGVRAGVRWYVAFLAVFLGSGVAGEVLGNVSPLPAWFTTTMLALNIAVGGTIVFTLLAIFAKQRQDALAALRIEQAKAENLLLNILPRSIADRLKAESHDDRRPVQLGVDPLRGRRRLHAEVGAPRAGRGRRSARPSLQPLRRARRAVRAREDQDDRRLLHGRRRRSHAAARSCAGPGPDGARHARGDALERRGRPSRARASGRDQLGPGRGRRHRHGSGSSTTCGATPSTRPAGWNRTGRRAGSRSPGRPTSCSRTSSNACRRGTITVKGKGEMEAWYVLGRRPGAAGSRGARRSARGIGRHLIPEATTASDRSSVARSPSSASGPRSRSRPRPRSCRPAAGRRRRRANRA